MKKFVLLVLLIPILLIDFGCKENSTEPTYNDTTSTHVRKPNLYIYPENKLELRVDITFPNGGAVTESIPDYSNYWKVIVEPNGKINSLYNYLYYECTVPEFEQKEFGWIISKNELKVFFIANLLESGFNNIEINDFIDYWIPILVEFEYYEIYPQYNNRLDNVIKINFSKRPDNFFRLCYLIVGRSDKNLNLKIPKVQSATRSNYFAIEWGVILK